MVDYKIKWLVFYAVTGSARNRYDQREDSLEASDSHVYHLWHKSTLPWLTHALMNTATWLSMVNFKHAVECLFLKLKVIIAKLLQIDK